MYIIAERAYKINPPDTQTPNYPKGCGEICDTR